MRGSTYSEELEVANGVPQGCVVSATLFLLAINDIFKFIPYNAQFQLFAVDDLSFSFEYPPSLN